MAQIAKLSSTDVNNIVFIRNDPKHVTLQVVTLSVAGKSLEYRIVKTLAA